MSQGQSARKLPGDEKSRIKHFSAEQFNNKAFTGLESFVTEKRCCE